MDFNLKAIKQQFKEKGVFYTETALAELVKSYLPQQPIEVYDPTCGNGGLLSVFNDETSKYGQELDCQQLEDAKKRLKNFTGIAGDTLEAPAFMDKRFMAIVANYPFSIKWQPPSPIMQDHRFLVLPCFPPPSKADYAFIAHCLYLLHDEGTAVIVCFPGILYRGNKEGEIRTWLIEQGYIKRVVRIPAKQFTDTAIETTILILEKHNKNEEIIFEDLVLNKKTTVSIKEVLKNNGALSVNLYVQPNETQKTPIDALKLQLLARKQMINKLKCDLNHDEWVCKLEGWNHVDYCKQLISVISEHISFYDAAIAEARIQHAQSLASRKQLKLEV